MIDPLHRSTDAGDAVVQAFVVQEKPQTVRVTLFAKEESEERGGWRRMS